MYTVAQWEAAIAGRHDIEFNEIYLKDGYVDRVSGCHQDTIQTERRQLSHQESALGFQWLLHRCQRHAT